MDAVLDSNQFNSDFVKQFRSRDAQWNYSFAPDTIYSSSRGGLIPSIRRLLNPVLKLFFNPNPLISALSRQSDLNRYYVLLLHNMAVEMTRTNLELTNIKARLRTLGIRVDFQTTREKTLESLATQKDKNASGQGGNRKRQRGGRRSYRRRRGGGGGGGGDNRDSRSNDDRGKGGNKSRN